jgi:uncharacterized protein YneF (UPF0154 family)
MVVGIVAVVILLYLVVMVAGGMFLHQRQSQARG